MMAFFLLGCFLSFASGCNTGSLCGVGTTCDDCCCGYYSCSDVYSCSPIGFYCNTGCPTPYPTVFPTPFPTIANQQSNGLMCCCEGLECPGGNVGSSNGVKWYCPTGFSGLAGGAASCSGYSCGSTQDCSSIPRYAYANTPAPVAPVSNPAPAPVSNPAPAPVSNPAPAPVSNPAPAPVSNPAPAPVSNPVTPVSNPSPLAGCFHGNNTVLVRQGNTSFTTEMRDLKIGDLVQVAGGDFEPVVYFARHWASIGKTLVLDDTKARAFYLEIQSEEGKRVVLTANHRLQIGSSNVEKPADQVQVGDFVLDAAGRRSKVVKITSRGHLLGAYMPITKSGSIVVGGGITASCFEGNSDIKVALLRHGVLGVLGVMFDCIPLEVYTSLVTVVDGVVQGAEWLFTWSAGILIVLGMGWFKTSRLQ